MRKKKFQMIAGMCAIGFGILQGISSYPSYASENEAYDSLEVEENKELKNEGNKKDDIDADMDENLQPDIDVDWGEEGYKVPSICDMYGVSSIAELNSMNDDVVFASSIPSHYESPYITSVKNQNPYGTCWAFSSIAASEASMWEEGLVDGDVDLSEWALAYFTMHNVPDPMNMMTGDEISINTSYVMQTHPNDLVTEKNAYLHSGGNAKYVTKRLADWAGVITDDKAPYSIPLIDSEASIEDQYCYLNDKFHLENAYWVSMKDMDSVKQLIMQYGAVVTNYHNDWTFYDRVTYAVYCPDDLTENHAITIIGWDDNYSKQNFGGDYKPEHDGAWLCKNSWGTDWGVKKDAESTKGYFWISYEDGTLLGTDATSFDYANADNYKYNYSYDGGIQDSVYTNDNSGNPTVKYSANVFTATSNQRIEAVGMYSFIPGLTASISVYQGCTDGPTSGTLKETIEVELPFAGYYTFELEEPVLVAKNQSFSIVIEQSQAGIRVDSSMAKSSTVVHCKSSAEAGQSYVSTSGTRWTDVGKSGYNCRIKAFSIDTDEEIPDVNSGLVNSISIAIPSSMTMRVGDSMVMNATIIPNTIPRNYCTWESSNSSVATIDSSGTITAKAVGTTTIRCKAESKTGSVSKSCTLQVEAAYTGTESFCVRLYSLCLGRNADDAGLKDWNNRLVSKRASGAQVAQGFVFSEEYTKKNTTDEQYVTMLYGVFMDRKPDTSGYNYWIERLRNGVSREYVFMGFAESQEFTNICKSYGIERGSVTLSQPRDKNYGVTAFCSRLYTQALGRNYEVVGLNDWCNRILTGQYTPEQAAEGFITSQEFTNKRLSNAEYVKVLYRTFMGREYDQAGLNYWVKKLDSGMSRQEVLHGFSRSMEFHNIMAQYGL